MKKILSKILISALMVIIFLAPVSPGLKTNGENLAVKIEINTVRAQNPPATPPAYANKDQDIGCSASPLTWFTNCIAVLLYYALWQPMSFFAHTAGSILDFFVYYSTNSSSYSSAFVGTAWAAVRDIANIFFIVALLYIAIATILNLGKAHGKKMIATIIIVALLINFSLFFTQVIIDGTNILAKVFYNQVAQTTVNGNDLAVNANGDVSISTAIAAQFDPKGFITDIPNNVGLFIFITLLSVILFGFMIYIFLSVALLFVSRVASLWIAMIFAPIAFASYTVPFDIPGFGHKNWWDELLKNAFLAPIFIFFLYLILLFQKAFTTLQASFSNTGSDMQGLLDGVMKVIIPFMLVGILLWKAKDLAVKFSGEMGAAFNKVGGTVLAVAGGAVAGLALGGAAMAGRATLGRAGAAVADSSWAKRKEAEGAWYGKTLRNVGKRFGTGSMDLRGVKVGGKGIGEATGLQVGKATEGGVVKMRADKTKARQERANELKVGESSALKQKLNKTEGDLQGLLTKNAAEIDSVDKLIEKKRQDMNDTRIKVEAGTASQQDLKGAADALDNAKNRKTALREGRDYNDGTTNHKYSDTASLKDAQGNITGTIDKLEKQKKADVQNINVENAKTMEAFAQTISSPLNKTLNLISSGGQHSSAGADEAAHKIRVGVKLDSGTKT